MVKPIPQSRFMKRIQVIFKKGIYMHWVGWEVGEESQLYNE